MVVIIPPVAAGVVAVVGAALAWRRRGRRLVVVGPPGHGQDHAGSWALGRATGCQGHSRGVRVQAQMEGRHAVVSGVDLPGDDALR